MLIDYSKDLDQATYETTRFVTVTLPEGYRDAECLYGVTSVGKQIKNGYLTSLSAKLLRQQSVLLKLVK